MKITAAVTCGSVSTKRYRAACIIIYVSIISSLREEKQIVVFLSLISIGTAVLSHCWEQMGKTWHNISIVRTMGINYMFMHWDMFQRCFQRQHVALTREARYSSDEDILMVIVRSVTDISCGFEAASWIVISVQASQYCFRPWAKETMRTLLTVFFFLLVTHVRSFQ